MALSNRERVGKALDLMMQGLQPFVEREMRQEHGERWQEVAQQSQRREPRKGEEFHLDSQVILSILWNNWNSIFGKTLGHAERSLVSELRDVRNRWAHQHNFSSNDSHRALDSTGRLLAAVSAPQADEVERMRMDLLRVQFDEQRRTQMRKTSVTPVEGKPQGGLKPWREVVTPHPDVASGDYQQAEFAADLWQVYLGEGSDEYRNPLEFYRRTFLTDGLKKLLIGGLERLLGKGGDPVVELQTNFGGGKTHSMLALWHLFSGATADQLPGIEEVLKESGLEVAGGVRRAVLVGTKISPGQPVRKPDGTEVRTLWGELAWQLGDKEAFDLVREADQTSTNPGDALKDLFNKYAPCLVLIDEWVAYARQLHEDSDLPAGNFDTQFTFAQTLSESAKAADRTMLVVSIPASDNEIGGQWGQQALTRLKNAIGRVESSWRPASVDEGFEIVRRRLFQPLPGNEFVARDAVARAFSELYGSQHQEFPLECREADYERRIKMAYPIHPELFDRLFNDWSTLDRFQRTRGVLRLMAAVIHSLWERQDSSLLIMPANVPVDDPPVQFELTRYMSDPWVPVIEKDVDGPNSLPLTIDRENPNLGRFSASRRVARTIYMGSAPIQQAANRGIEDRQVKLGCVQPGESVATFGDSLRRLTDRATYLYVDGKRYWYSTQPTVARLADDRAQQLADHDVTDEIEQRLREDARTRGDFAKIHPCASSGDVPDERETRLVILGPDYRHTGKDTASTAREQAATILEKRGTSSRTYRNTLVFVAADSNRLRELQQAVRQYLAWTSIWSDRETLNLDALQTKQAETKRKGADETVKARIPETFQWLLVPGQPDPKGDIEWSEVRLSGRDSLAVRASKKLQNEELLITQLGGVRLRHELDRIPLWRGEHVELKQLSEDIATYLYLPRLRDETVLTDAIHEGVATLTWATDTFAYAEGWDEAATRYTGLVAGKQPRVIVGSGSVVVKPDVAQSQIDAESKPPPTPPGPEPQPPGPGPEPTPPGGPPLKRFHGTVTLDPMRVGRDAAQVADAVIQHLSGIVGAEVEVTLEVSARLPEAASEKLVRDVTENCTTLKFRTQGFEPE